MFNLVPSCIEGATYCLYLFLYNFKLTYCRKTLGCSSEAFTSCMYQSNK